MVFFPWNLITFCFKIKWLLCQWAAKRQKKSTVHGLPFLANLITALASKLHLWKKGQFAFTWTTGQIWTGKKLMENMMTTAINILATFRRVFSWLLRFLLAELGKIAADVLVPPSSFRLCTLPMSLDSLRVEFLLKNWKKWP